MHKHRVSSFILLGMAYHPTFMTKYTTSLGPRTTLSICEYTDGGCKVFFAQSFYKKQEDSSGERCLSMNTEAWYKIEQSLWQIEQVVEDIKNGGDSKLDLEISDDIRLRINATFPFINIRKFWSPPNGKDKIPTADGVCVKFDEYTVLKNVIPTISSLLPEQKSGKSRQS